MKTFTIDESEENALDKWVKMHDLLCTGKNKTAIGGRYTYSFTPTSIGTVSTVKCVCGKSKDFTDYKSW